jgi:prophage regulatory protein
MSTQENYKQKLKDARQQVEEKQTEQQMQRRVLLSAEDLWQFGCRYSRVQLWKLVKAKQFPAPIKLSSNRNAWLLSEVLAWVEQRVAERGAA